MKRTLLLLAFAFTGSVVYAQEVGSKVILKTNEGSYYTGTVAEISNGKYRVLYDNTDFEAWVGSDQFSIAANPTRFTSYKGANEQKTTVAEPPRNKNNAIPTQEDIITALRKIWEKEPTTLRPKTTITISNLTIGTSAKANYALELEGVPKNAMVTSAKIDFTENQFHTSGTQKVRRIMTTRVYRDQFNEWAVMSTGTIYPDR